MQPIDPCGLFEQDVVADYLLYKLNLRLAADAHLTPNDPAYRALLLMPAILVQCYAGQGLNSQTRHTHPFSRFPAQPPRQTRLPSS